MQAGRYIGRATGYFRFGTASTGTPQIGIEFELVEGPHKGRRWGWYGTLASAESLKLVQDVIAACIGREMRSWKAFVETAKKHENGSLHCPHLSRHEVSLVFQEDEDEETGEVKVRLMYVNRAGGVFMKTDLAGKELAALLANLDKPNSKKENGPAPADGVPF